MVHFEPFGPFWIIWFYFLFLKGPFGSYLEPFGPIRTVRFFCVFFWILEKMIWCPRTIWSFLSHLVFFEPFGSFGTILLLIIFRSNFLVQLELFGSSVLKLEPFGSSSWINLFLKVLEYSWIFLNILEYPWVFLKILEYSRVFLNILDYSWIILSILKFIKKVECLGIIFWCDSWSVSSITQQVFH